MCSNMFEEFICDLRLKSNCDLDMPSAVCDLFDLQTREGRWKKVRGQSDTGLLKKSAAEM